MLMQLPESNSGGDHDLHRNLILPMLCNTIFAVLKLYIMLNSFKTETLTWLPL